MPLGKKVRRVLIAIPEKCPTHDEAVKTLFAGNPMATYGIKIAGDEPRRFLLMPGGAPPTLDIDLSNPRGAHKIVRIDPITGVPQS